jgi:hypothetical protein
MKAAWPWVKGGSLDPWYPRVQRGDPDYPHHHHIAAREHSGTPNHPNCHGMDHRTATSYRAPPLARASLSGGEADTDPRPAN